MTDIQDICKRFGIDGKYLDSCEIPNGNINKTYHVAFDDSGRNNNYILQRINKNVFGKPLDIMKNIDAVTEHIIKKINGDRRYSGRQVLKFRRNDDGNLCFIDDEGEYWRVCPFIENSVTYNTSNDPDVLYSTGKAFGEFQMQLADFEAGRLYETIPNFHNTRKRLEHFYDIAEKDPCGRADAVKSEIEYLYEKRETGSKLTVMTEKGEMPLRVTHNDTKCNNVLFNEKDNEPLAVIDLDTVMPGLAVHDFGDAVRFAANTAAEDEKDISKVSLNLDLFKAFSDGFIGQTSSALTKEEIEAMPLGALTMTIELAARFLDDYLNGDKYFKVNYAGHNLDRARCQIALAKDMERKYDGMMKIVEDSGK